ncbi:sterol-binding-like protein [Nannocystaceae bacterium ST9]
MTDPDATPIGSEPIVPERGPIAALLAESFELLAARLPQAHARVLGLLRGHEVELRLDHEAIALRFGPGVDVRAATELDPARPRIECSLGTIVAVLDARLTLAEALESDSLRVRADLERLVHLHEGLLAYVHGAVRCPGFPELLLRLRVLAHHRP